MFSKRTSWDLSETDLERRLSTLRKTKERPLDLSEVNPTRARLFDSAPLIEHLGDPRGAVYVPDPLGAPDAREVISAYYAEKGASVPKAQILLTASTSESYAWLFKILADPGDSILIAQPSYPLFDWLAAAEGIELQPFSLSADEHYRLHVSDIERRITPRTRALVLVHPGNPTGAFVHAEDASDLVTLATRHNLPLIVDEVFADYAFGAQEGGALRLPTFAGTQSTLTFVLSGVSKVLLLPQCKLGWIAASGPLGLVTEALRRLEMIADTFLSVSTPVQLALPHWMGHRHRIQNAAKERLLLNLATLDGILAEGGAELGVRRHRVQGGWYATLEIPRFHSEEVWLETFLREEGVIVQPGYFFDHAREGLVVISLLTDYPVFEEGLRRMLHCVRREGAASGSR